ncbi:MAG TPA: IS1595 family transposase [Candidatus Binataceae bacterium]|nr:IS1595 family transposase [Candidatus Binataceae bacterium]
MDETAAVEFFEEQRWGDEPLCAHCQSDKVYKMGNATGDGRNKRFLWRCRACNRQYTVRVGTVYEDSPIPLRHWAYAFWKACSSKKGVSALQIKRETGLTYKSALFLMHRIRFAMAQNYAAQPKMGDVTGIIEADETYVGGRPRHKAQSRSEAAKEWKERKTPVFSIVERDGTKRSFVTTDVTAENLGRILQENVSLASHLMTDTAGVYRGSIGKPFARHSMTDHTAREYAKPDGTHSNTVESAFSLLKRGIYGTFHNVSRKHLHRYVAEFDFRWNARKIDDGARTVRAIKSSVGKRLRYREPVLKVVRD